MLIAVDGTPGWKEKRKYFLVISNAGVEQEIVGNLCGPQQFENVGRFDLHPACILRNKLERSIAAIESVLRIVEPDAAESIFRIDLPIETHRSIRLVIDIRNRRSAGGLYGEDAFSNVVTAIGSEEPQFILYEWSA